MVGRLHDHDLLLRRIDAEIGEQLEPERLRAVGDQHHVDAADPHGGAVADRNLGRPEALPGSRASGRSPRPSASTGWPEVAADLAAEAQRRTSRPARRRSRAAPRSDPRSGRRRRPRRCARSGGAGWSVLSDGAPPPALSAGSAITTGRSLKATPRPTPASTSKIRRHASCRACDTSSSPSLVASASAFALSPSAITSTRRAESRPRRRRESSGRSRPTGCRPCPPSP